MINRIVLVGRLTRDPELRPTNSGNSVCNFSVAVDNRTKDEQGNRTTSFIPCVAFSQSADNMTKFLKKGALVGVEGRLTQRKFTRQDGSTGSVLEVICDSVQFLEPKAGSNNAEQTTENKEINQTPAAEPEESLQVPDDDLPW